MAFRSRLGRPGAAALIVLSGVLLSGRATGAADRPSGVDQCGEAHYALLDPALLCNAPAGYEDIFGPLQQAIARTIDTVERAKDAEAVSVFVRDLTSARWFGINEHRAYAGASLLKVPTAIAVMKIAENSPALLERRATYDGARDFDLEQNLRTATPLVAGREYSMRDLVQVMLRTSSNNAAEMIYRMLNADETQQVADVFTDLGVWLPRPNGSEEFLTVKVQGDLFRALYRGAYLSPEASQSLLDMMLEGGLKNDALRAAFPPGILISHKFGERSFKRPQQTNTVFQFHDCGIVYAPSRPFVLCVMSEGRDFPHLTAAVRAIGEIAYKSLQQTLPAMRAIRP
jgi:beta-lactamase class A